MAMLLEGPQHLRQAFFILLHQLISVVQAPCRQGLAVVGAISLAFCRALPRKLILPLAFRVALEVAMRFALLGAKRAAVHLAGLVGKNSFIGAHELNGRKKFHLKLLFCPRILLVESELAISPTVLPAVFSAKVVRARISHALRDAFRQAACDTGREG